MRAIISKQPGGPETLVVGDLPRPQPGGREVLIKVHACSVNYPDALIIQDRYQIRPVRPFAPGSEVAGTVEEVGPDAGFEPGQRVMASTSHGGMADYLLMDAQSCFRMPDDMPFEEGACLPMTYGTSFHALRQRGHLHAGETLLVLGAGGGVGLAAVELGKAMGARVIAAVSSRAKAAAAIARGADQVMVYPAGPFNEIEAKALSRQFKDVICPLLSGPISILEMAMKEEWNGKEAQAGRHHRQAA